MIEILNKSIDEIFTKGRKSKAHTLKLYITLISSITGNINQDELNKIANKIYEVQTYSIDNNIYLEETKQKINQELCLMNLEKTIIDKIIDQFFSNNLDYEKNRYKNLLHTNSKSIIYMIINTAQAKVKAKDENQLKQRLKNILSNSVEIFAIEQINQTQDMLNTTLNPITIEHEIIEETSFATRIKFKIK